jgi:uncharacterized phiE125 gp8 family phage protein
MLSIKDYTLITPANIEPITLDEVKQRLRLIGNGDFDSELTRLITVAREMCERITGRDLINKTYKGFLYCHLLSQESYLVDQYKNLILQTHHP